MRLLALAALLTASLLATPSEAQMVRRYDQTKLVQALNGAPSGDPVVIDGTSGSARNATAFTGGTLLLVQCTTAASVFPGDSTVTATTANGIKLAVDEKFYMLLQTSQTHLAVITGSCRVWTVQ